MRESFATLRTLGVRVNLNVTESIPRLYRWGPKSDRAATSDEQIEERTDCQTH